MRPHPKLDAIAHKTPKWDLKREPQENDHYNPPLWLPPTLRAFLSVPKLEALPNGSYGGNTVVRLIISGFCVFIRTGASKNPGPIRPRAVALPSPTTASTLDLHVEL